MASGENSDTSELRVPGEERRQELVPRCCTLEGFARKMSSSDGVGVRQLEPITRLLVHTQNTLYRITVVKPFEGRILIQGGSYFPEATLGRLLGSSVGGSMLKISWIGVGLRLEIGHEGQRIVTSPVRSLEVEDDSSLPGPF